MSQSKDSALGKGSSRASLSMSFLDAYWYRCSSTATQLVVYGVRPWGHLNSPHHQIPKQRACRVTKFHSMAFRKHTKQGGTRYYANARTWTQICWRQKRYGGAI